MMVGEVTTPAASFPDVSSAFVRLLLRSCGFSRFSVGLYWLCKCAGGYSESAKDIVDAFDDTEGDAEDELVEEESG